MQTCIVRRLAVAMALCATCVMSAQAGTYRDAVLGMSPDHYYPLNETVTGDAADIGTNPVTGAYVGDGYDAEFPPPDPTVPRGGVMLDPTEARIEGWVGAPAPETTHLLNRADGNPGQLPLAGFGDDDRSLFANNSINVEIGPSADFSNTTMAVAVWFKSICNEDPTVVCDGPPASRGGERIFSTNANAVDSGGASDLDDSGHLQIDYGWGANLVISMDNRFSDPLKSNFQVSAANLKVKNESWHHIMVSRNGDLLMDDPGTPDVREGITLVVDGVEITEDLWQNSTDSWGVTDGGTARIGGRAIAGTTDHTFSGWLSDFAMWLGAGADGNAKIGVADARAMYRAGLNLPNSGANLDAIGGVDAADAGIMFANWTSDSDPISDINSDLTVDAADAGVLFSQWTGDPGEAPAGSALAEYNAATGQLLISANGVVNAFVESNSGALVPGDLPDVPAGVLPSKNPNRVGLTGFGGIVIQDWGGDVGAGHAQGDLRFVVGPALGVPAVSYEAGSANFAYIPEPASGLLFGLGLLGLASRREKRGE